MTAIADLTEEECYLVSILVDPSGIEMAEFLKHDPTSKDGCYRVWPFQYPLYRSKEMYQIDWCFPEGTMVLTDRGSVPIQDVCVGDLVVTHTGQWKPVINLWDNGIKKVDLHDQYGSPLECTPNHELLTRLHRRKTGTGPVEWTSVGSISDWTHDRHYQIASVHTFPSYPIPDICDRYAPGRVNDLTMDHFDNPDFWWLVGLYSAEGSLSSSYGKGGTVNRVSFSVHEDEVTDIEKRFIGTGLNYSVTYVSKYTDTKGALITVNSVTLATWLNEFCGRGSSTKHIHPSLLNHQLRKSFFDGACFGDGHFRGNTCEYVTVSRRLAYDMLNLSRSLGMQASVRVTEGGEMGFPGGRVCQIKDSYTVSITLSEGERKRVWFEDDYAWTRLSSVSMSREVRVYDLEVADDHSYTANGFIVHNCSRAIGKTVGIVMRMTGFVFSYPGQEALILAPSQNHLDPITKKLRQEVEGTRLLRELLPKGRSNGITNGSGGFLMMFSNGSKILGRIPGLKGKNTKGVHSIVIETDESQEFDNETWIEILESLERTQPDAVWRAHGVSRGARDKFYKFTQGEDPDLPWFVHRYPAMYRPTWSEQERREKVALYGGSRTGVDYLRNVHGDHGDVSNRLFVVARLNNCTLINETPWAITYNSDVYYHPKINDEFLRASGQPIEALIDPPSSHLDEEYIAYYGGADFGFTNDPTELLIFGEVAIDKKTSVLRLLSRIHMQRISAADQAAAIRHVFEVYGSRLLRITLDKTGAGLPIYQELDPDSCGTGMAQRRTPDHISQRIKGYGFSEKIIVELDDRELEKNEKPEDAVIKKTIIEYGIDQIRKLVDAYPQGHIELPYDKELLSEWQGSEVQYTRDETGSGVRRALKKAGSGLHTLDAALLCIAGKDLMKIETAVQKKPNAPVAYNWG